MAFQDCGFQYELLWVFCAVSVCFMLSLNILQKYIRVGGRDKCAQKQFLKMKEHKILSTGRWGDTAVHSSRGRPWMTRFHDFQTMHQGCNCNFVWVHGAYVHWHSKSKTPLSLQALFGHAEQLVFQNECKSSSMECEANLHALLLHTYNTDTRALTSMWTNL